ncbi:helix-turn-helix transcriptional regulator [uncultured Ruminococcus sp.]|uniref:helix-turn-helix domain-containing protein n=1 Tax=uncultured Ruminococcus sp. TaxID=165186 RepID=UPI0025F66E54|nr:helix-turn-helix transcriptional regulator [uncultured Ruminococcus sp.]
MNSNELKAEIVRNNLTIPKLAKLINVNKTTLYSRISGKTPFTQKEITAIAKILNLSKEKIFFIFFTDKVA